MKSMTRLTKVASALVTALTVAFTSMASPAQAQAPTQVTIRMDVFFYGAHVPILMGIAEGIYKKYGLEVTALPGRGSATTIQTVATGTDQFGWADGGTLVKFAAQGLKAKQIVGMLQSSPSIILALPDSGIKTAKDLNNRTGGFGNGSAPEQIFGALAKAAGIDINSIKRVAVDIPTRDNLFIQKQIDFSFGYTVTQLPLMEEKCNCKINVIKYSDYNIVYMANGVMVGDQYAAANPDVVKRFAQATQEAIELAVKDPERGINGFFKYATETKLSRPVVTNQWLETIKLLRTKATAGKPYGTMAVEDWQRTIDLLQEYADLPKGSVKPEMVFTNEYLKK